MGVKKDLENTPLGLVVTGLVELVKTAGEFSFEKEADGGMRAAFTLNAMPAHPVKVVIKGGGPAGFNLNLTSSKSIPGQVQGKARRKPPR